MPCSESFKYWQKIHKGNYALENVPIPPNLLPPDLIKAVRVLLDDKSYISQNKICETLGANRDCIHQILVDYLHLDKVNFK